MATAAVDERRANDSRVASKGEGKAIGAAERRREREEGEVEGEERKETTGTASLTVPWSWCLPSFRYCGSPH